jgi:hypothetical protein
MSCGTRLAFPYPTESPSVGLRTSRGQSESQAKKHPAARGEGAKTCKPWSTFKVHAGRYLEKARARAFCAHVRTAERAFDHGSAFILAFIRSCQTQYCNLYGVDYTEGVMRSKPPPNGRPL